MSSSPETDTAPRPRDHQRLWRSFWRYRAFYVAGTACLVLTNVLALAIPGQLGRAMDLMRHATPEGFGTARDQVIHAAIAIIALAVAAGLVRILSRVLIFNAGRSVEYDLRTEVHAHLQTLGPRFFQRITSGDLSSRIANDASSMRLLFGMAVLNLVNTAIAYILALSKMLAISPMLTLWCLVPFPLGFALMRAIVRATFRWQQRVQEGIAGLTADVQQTISGIAVVNAFSAEAQVRRRFAAASADYVRDNLTLARVRGAMQPLMALLGSLGSLIVLYLGGRFAIERTISLGQFVEFSAYVVILAWPTVALGFVLGIWQRGMAAYDRLLEVLAEVPDVRSPDQVVPTPDLQGRIELRRVTVTYGERRVLDDVSVIIEPGQHVAIVGWTGAGKTTLLNLVPRLLDPTEGKVLVDGVDVRDLDLHALRRQLAVVPQEGFLFSATVADNIAYGLVADAAPTSADLAALRPRLERAAELAGLSGDLQRFPRGLDTLVGERGIAVSGGQRQRLTIARALVRQPRILVLDDALSSVDTDTERAIFEAVRADSERRTILMATHRFHGLEHVDLVVVLRDGRVVESGTHRQLLERRGVYADLWLRQQLAGQLDATA